MHLSVKILRKFRPYRFFIGKVCVKCAGNHQTVNCPKKSRTTDVRCVLCDDSHPANYKACAVYQSLPNAKFPPPHKPTYVQTILKM